VPGYQGDAQDDGTFIAEARRIGFPVMVKAAAGGGGRGMRLVHVEAELGAALKSARSEAKNAFGDDTLLLERAVMEPRHVEIQIFGDTHGNVIHLGERDCSIQRRHQKVVEEAPSPAVDAQLRARMGMAAVKAAQSIGYVGAGTVEFLLDMSGEFYFLEMNTRLQVEHPVTELVTGLDLVTMQLDVAMGLPLPVAQDEIRQDGHAIEVRLYAEDPVKSFLPQTGDVLRWRPAEGAGIRVDHGLRAVDRVSPFYDPMVAKVIAWGRDRDEARQRLIRAVEDTTLFGIASNKAFLSEILKQPEFAAGQATTGFISRHFGEGWAGPAASGPALLAAAYLFGSPGKSRVGLSPPWRGGVLHLARDGSRHEAVLAFDGSSARVKVDGAAAGIEPVDDDGQTIRLRIDGHTRPFRYFFEGATLHLDDGGAVYRFEDVTYAPAETSSAGSDGVVRAPMNGLLRAIDVSEGMAVTAGQPVAILEAMKMEHRILAPIDGIISSVSVGAGVQVAARDVLLRIGEASA
jgi:geranyl-CoA carboxylase alpha subunit